MSNEANISNDQCHHIFPDNHRCGSPRMRDRQFCYHHDSRRPIVRRHERLAHRTFSLFTPTDFDAIQKSLGELLVRIAAKDIDPRRAGLLLYCLQIASTNLRTKQWGQPTQLPSNPSASEVEHHVTRNQPSPEEPGAIYP